MPPGAEVKVPLLDSILKAQLKDISKGLCVSMVFSSAWLYDHTLIPAPGTRLLLQPHGEK